jgi:hypothetical protein
MLPPAIDPFNALSTAAAIRKIPPLKEASPAKVMSCVLIASTGLQKDLDATKEVTGGSGAPSAKMAGVTPKNSISECEPFSLRNSKFPHDFFY